MSNVHLPVRAIFAALTLSLTLIGCGMAPIPAPAADPQDEAVAALTARIDQLEAERDVLAVIDALDFAVDAKNWTAARALFTDQIQVDFSSLGGQPSEVAADALVSGWRANLYDAKPSFRLRGGAQVNVDGDAAQVLTNGYVWNALPERAENNFWETWGRYEYRLTRVDGVWKITTMAFRQQHQRGDASVRAATRAP